MHGHDLAPNFGLLMQLLLQALSRAVGVAALTAFALCPGNEALGQRHYIPELA